MRYENTNDSSLLIFIFKFIAFSLQTLSATFSNTPHIFPPSPPAFFFLIFLASTSFSSSSSSSLYLLTPPTFQPFPLHSHHATAYSKRFLSHFSSNLHSIIISSFHIYFLNQFFIFSSFFSPPSSLFHPLFFTSLFNSPPANSHCPPSFSYYQLRKPKRIRTAFSPTQIVQLEEVGGCC